MTINRLETRIHMMKVYAFIGITLMTVSAFCQDNLVLNPGFEENSKFKSGAYQLNRKKILENWRSSLRHSPTLYITPRKSIAVAKSGYNSVGLLLGSSRQNKTKLEYLTGELKTPLIKGETYCICFNTLLHRTSRWAATDFGFLLHHDRKVVSDISDPQSMTATAYLNDGKAVTNTKWQKYCVYYQASGGEKYLSFGKFGTKDAADMKALGYQTHYESDNFQSKAYYLLDDISVIPRSADTDCGCATPPPPPEDSLSQKPALKPYLFALDGSGSMKKGGLFDSLRVNLKLFLEDLPLGTPVSFVTFASSSRKLYAAEVDENTPETVDSLLARASLGGGTNVFVGLQLAYESWQTAGPDSAKMVLVSDGEFEVTPKITGIVKSNFETEGRKLTVIQVGSRANGMLRQLNPYMDEYIHTTASEISQVIAHLREDKGGLASSAVACECINTYPDTMNYHFVVDYSGSMAQEKMRAIMAVQYLFRKAPDNAMISITSFDRQARELFRGKKSDIDEGKISSILFTEQTGGGTDPVPGIQHALSIAEELSQDRFSHVVLVTDLTSLQLSRYVDLSRSMKSSMQRFDLASCAITVDGQGLITTHSQFDVASGNYVGVGRLKFERDLFETERSTCNYTSQPYHYNPAKSYMKTAGKRFFLKVLFESIGVN